MFQPPMQVNAKKILNALRKGEKERGPKTIYVNLKLYDEFAKACGEVPSGKVIEALMREFVASTRKK